jgi:hypothetical protein
MVPFLNTTSFYDPFIGGFHQFFQICISHHPVGDGVADASDF